MAKEQPRGWSPLRLNILKRSPRKELQMPRPVSWMSGSTGSPSPGSRRAERCRMDVFSCSMAASDWALKAWQNSTSISALCDAAHGVHCLIQVNMYDRPQNLPPGNPIAFDPVYSRSNCYLIVWDTTSEKSLQQALRDLTDIRKQQSSAAILLLGCDLDKDDTVDLSCRQQRQELNLEKLATSAESCTGSLTIYFAKTDADVEAAIVQLIFKSLLTNIDPSFFAQHEWIAAFHGSKMLLKSVWTTTGEQDMELCLEALVEGLDQCLRQKPRPPVEHYFDLATYLIERGAPGEQLGSMSKMHPVAVEEIIHHLRQLNDHSLNLSHLNLPFLNGNHLAAIAPLLHRIDVSHNQLERLPVEIFQLPNVVNIKASHNKLRVLPACSRWLCLGLSVLDVSFNQLICPAGSQDYNNFAVFQPSGDASASSIAGKALPGLVTSPTTASDIFTKSVFRTKSASQFSVAPTPARQVNKRFTAIPPSVQKMRNLASVNLRANCLEELPVWVTLLPKLWALDIRDNDQLHHLPPELARCRSLYLVQAEGLQLVNPPMSEVKRGSTAVICYLRSQLKESIPYNQLKLMLVGEAGVGKTTLLSCLSGGKIPKENLATVGIVMSSFVLSDRRKQHTQRIKFHCLDFAGQHEYDSTHQCFITHRAVYLGLFNVCHGLNGLRSLRPWLMSIQACAPSSPVILVGTHTDKLQDMDKEDFITMAAQECGLGQKATVSAAVGLPPVLSIHFVTATSQSNAIQRLEVDIYDLALKLQDMRSTFRQPYLEQAIPACYLALQDRLSTEMIALADNKRCPVLTHNELVALIQSDPPLDIEDSEELAQACRFLHEVGMILFFEPPRRPIGESLYFLQPQWLSDALARIVTTQERSLAFKGLLSISHLPLVFKDLLVPRSLYGRFLELLEAFEIIVPLDVSKTVHLVPALLPKDPSSLPVIDARRCMVRVYRLAFIPAGLWSRLIARLVNFFHLQPTEDNEEDMEERTDAVSSLLTVVRRLLMRKECTLDRRVLRKQRRQVSRGNNDGASSRPAQPQSLDCQSSGGPSSPEYLLSQLSSSTGGNNRTISIVTGSANDKLQEILDKRLKWQCWKTGGMFYLPTSKDIPAGVAEEYVLVQELDAPGEMAVLVHGNDNSTATTLLARTIAQVDTLLEEWYPGLCEYPCRVEQFVPCASCILFASQMSGPLTTLCNSARYFTVDECLAAIQTEAPEVNCDHCGQVQKLADIVPDLVLADLPPHCQVSTGHDGSLLLDRDMRNLLGKGAFGEVYGGFWRGVSAAVKLLLPIDETGSPRSLRDMYHLLRDEADILAHLQHPKIVKLLGVCLSPPCVVMELAPGGNLRGAIREAKGLPLPVVHHVVRQVSEGIRYLHDRNIIYRDLKPDNVLVWSLSIRQGVHVKLADYSLAKFASSSGQLLQTKGTEGYMAPEVACGSDRRLTYDCKADIFAVGVLLFECVCAQRPFWELSKWKFLEYIEEGAYPSLERGLEGCGDERSTSRKSCVADNDPLSPLSQRLEENMDIDDVETYDNISLTSLFSFWSNADSDDFEEEGKLVMSSRTGSVLFVKARDSADSECASEYSCLVEEDKCRSEDLCQAVCLQPLLERCLCAQPEARPSALEISLQLACCSGVRDAFGCSRYRSEMRLQHFTVVPKSCDHDARGPVSLQLVSCGSRQSGLLCLNIPSMLTTTFHLDHARNADFASVLSGPGARLSAIANTCLLNNTSHRNYLIWLGTLSGHILIFNPSTRHLEARLHLPAAVVCFCPLPKLQWVRNVKAETAAAMTVVAGLSNGYATLIKATITKSELQEIAVSGELDLGEYAGKGPVTCAALSSDSQTLWLSHGENISSFHVSKLRRLSTWNGGHKSDFCRGIIRHLEPLAPGSGGGAFCTSAQRSDAVRFWGQSGRLLRELNCRYTLPDDVEQACQITCLHADGRLLWIGTRSGRTLLFDQAELQLMAMCYHHSYVHWIGSLSSDDESGRKMARCSVLVCGSPRGEDNNSKADSRDSPGGSLFVRVDWIPD